MQTRHQERLQQLLEQYGEQRQQKKLHPEQAVHRNWAFRDRYSSAVRKVVIPVLQEFADRLRGKLESASIFHRLHAAGLKVKLDQWEDYEREIVFYGDEALEEVRVTHEGKGFAYLTQVLDVAELTPGLVETEMMQFLERVLEKEPLGRPFAPKAPAAVVEMRRPERAPKERPAAAAGERVAAAGPRIA